MHIVQLAAVADGGAEAEAGVGAEARNLGALLGVWGYVVGGGKDGKVVGVWWCVFEDVRSIFEAELTDLVQGAGALKHERMPKNEMGLRFCY